MKNAATATGILGMIIAVSAVYRARTFPLQDLEHGLGAGFFPLLVIAAIACLAIASLAVGIFRPGSGPTLRFRQAGTKRALWLLLFLVVFAAAFAQVGLLLPVVAFLVVSMLVLGAPWIPALLVGVLAGIAVHFFFATVLHVPFS